MSGGIAGRGQAGPAGPAGPMGPVGPQGDPAFTLAIGEVGAVPYGQEPQVTNVGTSQDQVWNLKLVTGATGVLTGHAPPTPKDGTSLGQLYYCASNQTYYGLVELAENDNKWRPIMTQESAIRTYDFDILAAWRFGAQQVKIVGHAAVMLDDVQRQATLQIHMGETIPISGDSPENEYRRYLLDMARMNDLIADLAQRGINAIPFTVKTRVNAVDGELTLNFLKQAGSTPNTGDSQTILLSYLVPPAPGTGDKPGVRAVWEDGRLGYVVNMTSPGGATEYGDAPALALPSREESVVTWNVPSDTQYTKVVLAVQTVVVPYA